jgi:CO dehydrogenase/acetyl-CoA synthase delta subunit
VEWGDWERRAVLWESVTATSLLHSGADVVVLRHPESLELVQTTINELMGG